MHNTAVRLLARREHSRAELRKKLQLRSHRADLIELKLDDLAAKGLQSDERFAESYVRMRCKRGYGSNKIRAELMSRDVDRDMIEFALSNTEECWVENATTVLSKKFPNVSYSGVDVDLRQRAKMQRYLWSRGYNSEQINLAIEHLSNS